MEFIAIFLFFAACVFGLIAVHETGHYFAGWLAGISTKDMRIRMLRFPQHVVLRSDDEWIAPTTNTERYVELVWHYLNTKPRVFLYVSGGVVFETFFVIVASVVLILSGLPRVALAIVGMSCCMLIPWLVIDAVMITRGRIFGDFSGLWLLSPVPTAFIILFMVAVRGMLLWWAMST